MKYRGYTKPFMQFKYIPIQLVILVAIDTSKWIITSCKCDGFQSNFLIPPGYNKYQTPLEEAKQPTYVYVNLNIMDIDEIIEERMEFSMQFYVNEYWKDDRLNMTFVQNYSMFRVPREWVQYLWLPDTIFENSKGGWIYPLSLPNIVVQIRSLNYLHRFTRYAMRVTCAMDLHYYPMDTQICFLQITSLAYDNTKVIYKWMHERKEGSEGIDDLTLAKLKPLKYHMAEMSTGHKISQWSTESFTVIYANFTLVRHLSSHIMNVYIPTGLVVVLAFLTFWLDVKSVPARIALGLTSLLTLSTQASQSRVHLPQINYLTALDIWLFACMILVALSLVEYAIVYHLSNAKIRKRRQVNSFTALDESWAKRTHLKSSSGISNGRRKLTGSKNGRVNMKDKLISSPDFEDDPEFLDKICRLLFPTMFFMFSLVYWIHFLKSVA